MPATKLKVKEKMCEQCPFSRDAAQGWLGPYDHPQELHRMIMSEVNFPCHKTMDRDLSPTEAGDKRYPLCRGALLYMKRNAKVPLRMDLRNAMDELVDDDPFTVMSFPQFLEHHDI